MNTLERTLIEKAGNALGWENPPEHVAMYLARHAISYIMDTFPIVKRKDEAQHGHYRTKATILQIFDGLAEAMQTGQPYHTLLSPPPADPWYCRQTRN